MQHSQIKTHYCSSWSKLSSGHDQQAVELTKLLERGCVWVLPKLSFDLLPEERVLITPKLVAPKRKNISYALVTNRIKGLNPSIHTNHEQVTRVISALMQRYAQSTQQLVNYLFPAYQQTKQLGRTSLRVLDTGKNKPSSYRKDDSRLHIDAFPSTPMHGKRILRVFHNINPDGIPRVWRVGEPFAELIQRFKPRLTPPIFGSRTLMNKLGITKQYRTLYDHYMLQLHNMMKHDTAYQASVTQEAIEFAPGTTWIVYSDLVSHAAMSGQYMLEQTFYLDVDQQLYPNYSPLRQLENVFGRALL